MALSDDLRDDPEGCRAFLRGGYSFDLLPSLPDVLTIKTAAEALCVAPETMQRIAAEYKLPLVKNGLYPGIKKADFLSLIFENFVVFRPLDLPENAPEKP